MAESDRRFETKRALLMLCVAQAAGVFLQAVSAGSFLAGVDHSVRLHELGGWFTFTLAVVQAGLSALHYVRALGWWFVSSSATVAVAEVLQLGTGYGHFVQVHIPLALLIVAMLVWQMVWVATYRIVAPGQTAQ